VLAMARRGVAVTYIPGNHDAALRGLSGQDFGGVRIALDAVHEGADGRRYRVSHGDEFDAHCATPRWLLRLGDSLQGFVCAVNRRCNALLRLLGWHYRPLSILLKTRVGAAFRFIREFEQRVADDARAGGFDGHICGHIHYARLHDHDGVVYLNDGDWVEHCTGLVEHHDGTFELLHWTEQRLTLARHEASAPVSMPLPVAA